MFYQAHYLILQPYPEPLLAQEQVKNYSNAKLPSREDQLLQLKTGDYDVLVIGGGATGTGVALDSVSRGKARLIG